MGMWKDVILCCLLELGSYLSFLMEKEITRIIDALTSMQRF